jgi:hypothetical protein
LLIGVAQTASGMAIPICEQIEGDDAHPFLAEGGGHDAHAVPSGRQGIAPQRLERGLEQKVECFSEAASDNDQLGIERVDEARHASAEHPPHLLQHGERPLLSRPRRGYEILRRRPGADNVAGKIVRSASRHVSLEVAVSRAEAATLLTVEPEHEVTELGGRTSRPPVEAPAEDQTTPMPVPRVSMTM